MKRNYGSWGKDPSLLSRFSAERDTAPRGGSNRVSKRTKEEAEYLLKKALQKSFGVA